MSSPSQVAVFWDYENCRPPSNVSGFSVVDRIRRIVEDFGNTTVFKAYVDLSLECANARSIFHSELQSSGLSIIHCPHNGRKDVADKMMLVDMLAFAIDSPAPATIVLITGDRDFAYAAAILRFRGYEVIIIAPSSIAHLSLKSQACRLYDWQKDVVGNDGSPAAKAGDIRADESLLTEITTLSTGLPVSTSLPSYSKSKHASESPTNRHVASANRNKSFSLPALGPERFSLGVKDVSMEKLQRPPISGGSKGNGLDASYMPFSEDEAFKPYNSKHNRPSESSDGNWSAATRIVFGEGLESIDKRERENSPLAACHKSRNIEYKLNARALPSPKPDLLSVPPLITDDTSSSHNSVEYFSAECMPARDTILSSLNSDTCALDPSPTDSPGVPISDLHSDVPEAIVQHAITQNDVSPIASSSELGGISTTCVDAHRQSLVPHSYPARPNSFVPVETSLLQTSTLQHEGADSYTALADPTPSPNKSNKLLTPPSTRAKPIAAGAETSQTHIPALRFEELINFFIVRKALGGTEKVRSAELAAKLLSRDPQVYKKAGVTRLKEYIMEAKKADVIISPLLDAEGDASVEMNPKLYADASHMPRHSEIRAATTSLTGVSKPEVAEIFKPLVNVLRAEIAPHRVLYCRLGELLKKQYPSVYTQAGVTGLTAYLKKASEAGIVGLGGIAPCQWAELAVNDYVLASGLYSHSPVNGTSNRHRELSQILPLFHKTKNDDR